MTIAELRRIRMAKGLSLTEISRRTRIGVGHLRHIEEGELGALPPGFYARAFVRAYAESVGVDGETVLATLAEALPTTQAPGGSNGTGAGESSVESATLIPDARMHLLKQILDRHDTIAQERPHEPARRVASAGVRPPQRLLAAGIDGLLLTTLHVSVLAVTAAACGVSIPELVRVSGVAVFTVLALITVLYVLMMGGIAGHTFGAMLLDVPLADRPSAPLNLSQIGRRSVRFLRADVVAAVDVVSMVAPLFSRQRRAA